MMRIVLAGAILIHNYIFLSSLHSAGQNVVY